MPKNKMPSGGRPAKNFDPKYASKGGSRKPRWNQDDRDQRQGAPREGGFRRDDRGGDSRGGRTFNRDDRGGRSFDRDNRGDRSFNRDDRGGRSFDRDNRGSFNRDDRGGRTFNRDDRGARSFDRDNRGGDNRGGFNRDNRGARSFDRDNRGGDNRGGFNRDDRGGRTFNRDDRGGRSFDRDNRGGFNRNDRGGRSFDRDNRGGDNRGGDNRGGFNRDDRAPRSFDRGDRGGFNRDNRGGFNRDDRGGRSFDRGDRAPRRFDDKRDDRRDDKRSDSPRTQNAWQDRREAPQRTAKQEAHIDVVHERLTADSVAAEQVEGQSFSDLGLGDNICRALLELGAPSPFPIQAATIGPILAGKDVLGRGRTGSGKTIAFGAPLVEAILRTRTGGERTYGRSPQALIVAPTRELALQIDRTVQPIARSVGLFTTQIYGGVPQGKQVGALRKGVDIIIGTPGRIQDLERQGKLDLSQIQIAVLDEADHMCDLGFLEPVQEILRMTKKDGQKLLFSATLDREVSALVDEFLKDPQVYEVAGEDQDSGTIDHQVLVIDQRTKRDVIEQIAGREGRTIIFSRTRSFADELVEQLEDANISAIALHGDLNQAKRTRNIERFSKGRASVLVATDVAARGIHVDDVDLVVQADAPDEYKTYMHRSGRTGRAGNEGRVITLIPRNRRRRMSELLSRAEIDAPFRDAQPGDALIDELAG
ncbi:MAG: DEAD/DEAH box helicase [Microbacterium gubbeenense]|uniref:DEAD/DEAH box helicase n=1 Tax=Microbacterium gubbeenense TaxID=159896 RepID=UPI003F9C20E4